MGIVSTGGAVGVYWEGRGGGVLKEWSKREGVPLWRCSN